MIQDDKDLQIIKKCIEKFDVTIKELKTQERLLPPILAKAEIDALVSQRDEMVNSVEEYEKNFTRDET